MCRRGTGPGLCTRVSFQFIAAALIFFIAVAQPASGADRKAVSAQSSNRKVQNALPFAFHSKTGIEGAGEFVARGTDYSISVSPSKVDLFAGQQVSIRYLGASRRARAEALEPLRTRFNYILGNDPRKWALGQRAYERVRYAEIYPGIDVEFYGTDGQIEHDFEIAPQAQPSEIKLAIEGTRGLREDEAGNLLLQLGSGVMQLVRPEAYQLINGERRPVEVAFKVSGKHVSFKVGEYDRKYPLTIDPVLNWSTYLGGPTGATRATATAVDASGNIYVAGSADSQFGSSPNTTNAHSGTTDIFVAQFPPASTNSGETPNWITFYGGSGTDTAVAMQLDASRVFLTGQTNSTDFPVSTSGTLSTMPASGKHAAYIVSLKQTDGSQDYATYVADAAGDMTTTSMDMTVVSGTLNDVFVAGYLTGGSTMTTSALTTSNAYASTFGPTTDGFFVSVKYDSSGANPVGTLTYGTLLLPGTSGNLWVNAVQVSGASVYLAGEADNTIPRVDSGTPPCNKYSVGGSTNADGFVLAMNPGAGSTCPEIVWSNLFGEVNGTTTTTTALAVDSTGVYATGQTTANGISFKNGTIGTPPTGLATSLQDATGDAYLAQIALSTGRVNWFGYLGGTAADIGNAIVSDGSGNLIVAGSTKSSNFPTSNALDSSLGGTQDGFISIVNTTNGLVFSSYLGGSGTDSSNGLALVSTSPLAAVVAGETSSTGFPTNAVAFQTAPNGTSTNSATLSQVSFKNATDTNTMTVTPSVTTGGEQGGNSYPSAISWDFSITPGSTSTNATFDAPVPTSSGNPLLIITGVTGPSGCVHNANGVTCQMSSLSMNEHVVVDGYLAAAASCAGTCTSVPVAYTGTFGSAEKGSSASATATITVLPVTDLDVSQAVASFTGAAGPIPIGTLMTYTFSVKNDGPNKASTATAHLAFSQAALPATLDASTSSGCTETDSSHIDCAISNLASGASASFTVAFLAPETSTLASGTKSDTLTATLSVSSTAIYDTNSANDTNGSPVTTTIDRESDLDVSQATSAFAGTAGPVAIGGTITYTFKVGNNGPNKALNVAAVLQITPGPVPATLGSGTTSGCSMKDSTHVECDLASLNASATSSFTVAFAAPETSNLSSGNTSDTLTAQLSVSSTSVNDNTSTNNTDLTTVSTTIQRQSDLDVSQTAASFTGPAGPTAIGTLITYTFNVKNDGPDDLPNKASAATAHLTFSQAALPATLDATTSSACTETDSSHVDCAISSLAANASVSFKVAFLAPETATLASGTKSDALTATLSVSSSTVIDSNSSNNTNGSPVTTTIDRESDLDVSQATSAFTGTSGPVDIGDTITYTFKVGNNGPNKALNVAAVLQITPGPVPATLGSGTTSGCSMKDSTHVECDLASLNASATSSFTVVFAAPQTSNLTSGNPSDTLTAQLSVSSLSVNDNTSTNNTDPTTASTTIQRQADLDVSHAVSGFTGTGGTVAIGSLLTYNFSVKNNGPQTALNVVATLNFPVGSLPASLDATSSATCTVADSTHVKCTAASLLASASTSFVVAFPAPETANLLTHQTDTYTSTLSIASASIVDPVSTNNSDPTVVSTTIQRQSDLDVTQGVAGFTGPPGPLPIGTTMTYTFAVKNAGPDRAVNAIAHVAFTSGPVPSSFTGATSPGCAQVSNTQIDCTISSINAGSSSNVTLGFAAPSTTNLNSAQSDSEMASLTVSSTASFDGNSANNTNGSPVTTTIQRQVDLDVSQSTSGFTGTGTPVAIGGLITYNFKVGNNGPNTALNAVAKLMFSPGPLPATLDATTSLGCTRFSATEVDCAVASLAANATTPLVVAFAASETANLMSGSVSDTWNANLSVTSSQNIDTNSANDSNPNTVATTIRRQADLTVKTLTSNGPVTIGSPLTLTTTIQNNGPDDALAVNVQYSLSAAFTLNSQTFGAGNCSQAGNVLTCLVGTLKVSDGAQQYSITVVPDTTLVPNSSSNSTFTTSATISSTQVYDDGTSGAPGTNNTANNNATIQRSAKVSTSASGPATANLDDTVAYVFTVSSDPTSVNTATNLALTTAYPAGFHVSSASVNPPTFTCASDGSGCSGNSLPKGQSFTYTVMGTYPQSDPAALASNVAQAMKSASGTVTAAIVDTITNGGPTTLTLQRKADLVLAGLTDNSPLSLSVPLKLTTVLHNSGPDDSSGLVVTYTVPTANFTLNTAGTTYPTNACTQAGATITCAVSSLKAGSANDVTAVLAVNVDPAALGSNLSNVMLTSSATVSSTSVVDDGVSGAPGTNNTKSVTSNIQRQSNLAVTAVSDSSPAPLAGPLQYSASVKNNGPDDATGVAVSFALPNSNYIMTGSSVMGCTQAANTVTCPVSALTAGNSGTYTVTVTPDPGAVPVSSPSATIANSMTASIASPNVVDPDSTNNSMTLASTTLVRYTRLSISKNASNPAPGTFAPLGTQVSYEVDIASATTTSTSVATSAVSGIMLDEVYPASFTSLTLDSSSDTGWSCDFTMHPNCKYSGTLAPGGTTKLVIDGKYADDPALVSLPGGSGYAPGTGSSGAVTASLASPNSSNPDTIASVSTHTDLARVVAVSVVAASSPSAGTFATLGTDVTYTITASNGSTFNYGSGTAQAATASGLFLDVTVPSNFVSGRVDPSSSSGWTCVPSDFSSSVSHCTQANSLAPGAATTLVVKGEYADDPAKTSLAGGRGTLSVSIAPGLSASEQAASMPLTTATASTSVERFVHLMSTAVSAPAVGTFADLGTAVSYTFLVTNAATAQSQATNTATGVGVTVTLPANFVNPQTSSANWTCSFTVSPGTCTFANSIGSGGSADTLVIAGSYADDPAATILAGGGNYAAGTGNEGISAGLVASTSYDPSPVTVSTSTDLRRDVQLTVTQSAPSVEPVALNQPITYTIQAANATGVNSASNVVIMDTLPSGFIFNSTGGSGWSCGSPVNGVLTCTLAAIAPGGMAAPLTVAGAYDPALDLAGFGQATKTNTATISSTLSFDTLAGGKTASVNSTVQRLSDLTLAVTATPSLTAVGANIPAQVTYQLTVGNTGTNSVTSPSDPNALRVDFPFPLGSSFTVTSASGSGNSPVTCDSTTTALHVICTYQTQTATPTVITIKGQFDGTSVGQQGSATATTTATVTTKDAVDSMPNNNSATSTVKLVNTPTGANVTPYLVSNGNPITVVYPQVTGAGVTSQSTTPTAPAGFHEPSLDFPTVDYSITTATYLIVATDATTPPLYTTPVMVCAAYGKIQMFLKPERIRIFDGSGRDITVKLDSSSVCGNASTVSPGAFTVREPRNTPPVAKAVATQVISGKLATNQFRLDSSGSTDADTHQICNGSSVASAQYCADTLTYVWTGPVGMNPQDGTNTISLVVPPNADGTIGVPQQVTGSFPLGISTVKLTVTDQAGASSTDSVSVVVSSFSLSTTNQSASISAGQQTSFQVVPLDSEANPLAFSGNMALTCAGTRDSDGTDLSKNLITCSLSPSQIIQGAFSSALIVTTGPASARLETPRGRSWALATWIFAAWLPFGLVLVRGTRRKSRRKLVVLLLGMVGLLVSCGGGGGNSAPPAVPATPSGTYTIIISGNASGVTSTSTFKLTVH